VVSVQQAHAEIERASYRHFKVGDFLGVVHQDNRSLPQCFGVLRFGDARKHRFGLIRFGGCYLDGGV
jgi:hypothetical protein